MNALAITVGAGLAQAVGRYQRIEPPPVTALATILSKLPPVVESWWSTHLWSENTRGKENWRASSGIVVDIDYSQPPEVFPAADERARMAQLGATMPGNLFHLTPHGARLVLLFEEPCNDREIMQPIVNALIEDVSLIIKDSGYEVDEGATRDLARLFFAPNCIAKGVERHDDVVILRREPYAAANLRRSAEQAPAPRQTPVKKLHVDKHKSFKEAAAAWNYDNRRDYPKQPGTCPVCQHNKCFHQLPGDDSRWFCFSTNHPAVGVDVGNDGGRHGDALDLECFETGRSRVDVLRRDGYLAEPDYMGRPTNEQLSRAAPHVAPAEWEAPIPFDEFTLPPFPVRALPDWLREFIEAEAEATQTPPDLGAVLSLSVCGAALAKKVYAEGVPGWHETPNLYTVCALPPASRKTAVFRDLLAPVNDWEGEEADRLQPAIVSYLQRKRILEKQLASAEDRAAKAKSKQEREQSFMEAAELAQELDALPVVRAPRAIADDVTPEKLSNLLMDHGGRIALMSPEGGPFEMMAGRYSDKPNFEVYLKGHAGDEIRVDRKNGTADHIKRPAITIGLAVQPDVLRGLAATPSLRARGLLGRFLYSLPQSNIGTRAAKPKAVPEALRASYSARIKAMFALEPKRDRKGEIDPLILRCSPAAQEVFDAFRERLEPDLAEFGRLGWIQDWAGKLAGSILRILCILSINNAFQDPSILMSERSLLGAIEIGDYFTAHALAAFTLMGCNEDVESARSLLRCIGRHGWTEFSKRQLHQIVRRDARFTEPDSLDKPLRVLAEMNWIRPVSSPDVSGPGRRPSPRFVSSPSISTLSSQYRSDQ